MKCVIIYQDFFLVNARDWSIFIMCNKIFSLTNLLGLVSGVPAIAIIKLDLSRSQPDKKLPDQKFQKPPSFNPSTLTPSSVFYTFVAVLWQIKHIITIVPSILSLPHNTPFINPATIASSDNQCFQLLKLNGIYSFVFVLKTNYCPIDARLLALKPWKRNWVEQEPCPPSAVRCYPVILITRRVSHNFANSYPLKHSVLGNCQDFEELELQCFLSPLFIWDLAENLSASI